MFIILLCFSACGDQKSTEIHFDTLESQPVVSYSDHEDEFISDSDTVTLYCLVREEVYDEAFLIKHNTFGYDDSANLIKQEISTSFSESVWDEEYEVYRYELVPADDVPEKVYHFFYDRAGNITQAQYEEYENGEVDTDFTMFYSYSFNELGEITHCQFRTTRPLVSALNYSFTYQNGQITNVDVYMAKDGQSYGDRAQNYQFRYDEQGRLIQEQIRFAGHNPGEFLNEYKYDDKGLISSIVYKGSDEEGEYHTIQKFYHYDGTGGIDIYEGDDNEDPVGYQYYSQAGQFFLLPEQNPGVKIDQNGNICVIQCDHTGRRYEYAYQAIEVNREEAHRYYRRWHMINAYPVEWDAEYYFYYPAFFYQLIPNPIW